MKHIDVTDAKKRAADLFRGLVRTLTVWLYRVSD